LGHTSAWVQLFGRNSKQAQKKKEVSWTYRQGTDLNQTEGKLIGKSIDDIVFPKSKAFCHHHDCYVTTITHH
jgi:hypothetical protein